MSECNCLIRSFVLLNIVAIYRRFGFIKALVYIFFALINKITVFKIFECTYLSKKNINPELWNIDPKFSHGFMEKIKLKSMNLSKSYELSKEFIDDAYRNGDRCYAITEGDNLASYGWVTTKTNRVTEELRIEFDQTWGYGYKAFTHSKYRGHKLHGIVMTCRCKCMQEEGYHGLLSLIEINNFNSLRSAYRAGHIRFGKIIAIKLISTYFIIHSNGCKKFGFKLQEIIN